MRLFKRRPKAGLSAYSNESVIATIELDARVDRATARRWFGEMLVFLDMAAESDDFISPPRPVDTAWHAFILHTRDYEAYCLERFGRVIHHDPTGRPDPEAYRRAYGRRLQRGRLDPAIWALPPLGAAGHHDALDSNGRQWDPTGGDLGGGSSCGGGGGGACGGGGG